MSLVSLHPRSKRRSGCDLDNDTARRVFSEHILLKECSAKDLWRLTKHPWQAVAKAQHVIRAILSATGGIIPRQIYPHQLFVGWQADAGLAWSLHDSEDAVYDLRRMMSKLLRAGVQQSWPPGAEEVCASAAIVGLVQQWPGLAETTCG